MKKHRISILLCMLCIGTLSGCKKEPFIIDEVRVPVRIIEETVEEPVDVEEDSIVDSMYRKQNRRIYSEIGYSWKIDENNPIIVSGTMELTLQKAWTVNNINEASGSTDSIYDTYAELHVFNEQGQIIDTVRYPDFIMEDGSFIAGGQLVLLEITVHNIDAESEIARVCGYSSPYMFLADTLIQMIYGEDEIHVFFFKEARTYPDDPMVFQVNPGKEETICIGYLLSGSAEGGYRDLSFCKAQISKKPGNLIRVDLNLE